MLYLLRSTEWANHTEARLPKIQIDKKSAVIITLWLLGFVFFDATE